MKKIFDKIVLILLLCQPLIDVITYCQINNNSSFLSASIIFRSIIMIISFLYLFKIKKERKFIIFFILYVVLNIGYYLFNDNSLVSEAYGISIVFYYIILGHFFSNYKNDVINDRLITYIYLMYLLLITIPRIFLKEIVFNSINDVSSILIGLLPIVLNYIFKKKNYGLGLLIFIGLISSILVLGTKVSFFGFILVVLCFIVKYIKDNYKKISKKKIILIVVLLLILLPVGGYIFVNSYAFERIMKNINYFKAYNFDFYFINKVIFSSRLEFLGDLFSIFIKSPLLTFIFGLGSTMLNEMKLVEIDIFDILFRVGILGIIIYLILFTKLLINNKLKGVYLFSIILFIGISLFSGHVFLSTCVSIYPALLFLLNNNEEKKIKDKDKRVLFISSTGGHFNELMQLSPLFDKYNYHIIVEKDKTNKNMKNKYGKRLDYLPYGTRAKLLPYLFIFTWIIIKTIYFYIKLRPHVIITTGTHTAVPMCYLGHFFGSKVIFIETFANRTKRSLSGRMTYPIADMFIVQWEEMKKFYPNAIDGGSIF
ncbi:MAG: O-antigen ligase family protein [Bacilli bacterium]|nr:O-antigen ligase family protein [Bacilli bacterium]